MQAENPTHEALRAAILRAFFLSAAAGSGVGVLSIVMGWRALAPAVGLGLIAAYVLLGLACLGAAAWLNPRQGQRALVGVAMGLLVLVGASALVTGAGLQVPGLVFFGVIACLCCIVLEARHGLMIAAAALAVIAVIAAAEATGSMAPGAARVPTAVQTLVAMASVTVGAGAGRLIERLVQAHVHDSTERERRFGGLLGIAASAYWETDEALRMRQVTLRDAQRQFVPAGLVPRRPPWELPEVLLDDEAQDALRAHMEAREPFRDLAMAWHPPGSAVRHYLTSGEPQFDAQGRFLGYWGVARDVSAEHAAHAGKRQAEALLEQVVAMSPDVIALSDLSTGRYEMVNPSFTRVGGWTAEEAVGRTSTELGIWADPIDRQTLIDAVRASPEVRDLPLDFLRKDGTRHTLLVSAKRFEHEGRGHLAINARALSEIARTRLELEAILDNASVGIAFTRERNFVMANPHFEQMYGWPHGALVGQPGRVVWPSEASYATLGAEIGATLRAGQQAEFERVAMRRDGSTFLSRMRAKAIDPRRPGESGTIWIVEDVTAQRQAQAALARARDEAEAANRAKSAFLANTSHEIRTPLNGLVGLARLARAPDVDPQRLHLYLEQIGASAETLSAIISDILDLSKIEAGKLEIETEPFDLLALLHSLQQAYAALADSRGLAFHVDIDPQLPQAVSGDALRVRQILANFLHNALKFTPHGGVRLVAQRLPGESVRFEVHDSGVGIDEATQARLFRPFTQADESITRRFGGTGLGLSICRELAELMGGAVGVRSTAGQGSCFFAELPLPAVADLAAVSGHGALDADPLRGALVLLVEDNAVNMMIAAAMLEQWGAQVVQAGDGPQALAAVERAAQAGRPFDVVLMDVQMPGMSGYETTRLLRRRHSLLQLPIIALTAAALTSEREHAAEIGMNDFLTKPIDANRLRVTLQRVLAARYPG